MPAKLMSLEEPAYTAANGEAEIYDDGHLRVEHDNYYVALGGHALKLPRTEFLIISRLARNPERVVSSDVLWRSAWGDSKPLNTESLHVHIYRLRHKLEPYGIRLETMINVGYRLMPASRIREETAN